MKEQQELGIKVGARVPRDRETRSRGGRGANSLAARDGVEGAYGDEKGDCCRVCHQWREMSKSERGCVNI